MTLTTATIGDIFNVVVPCYGQTSEDNDTAECVELLPGDQVRFDRLNTRVSDTAWVSVVDGDRGAVLVSWPSMVFKPVA